MAERIFVTNKADTLYPKHTVDNLTDVAIKVYEGTTDITTTTAKVEVGTQGTKFTVGNLTRYPFPITFKIAGNFLIIVSSATVEFNDPDLNCNVIVNDNKDVITKLTSVESNLEDKIAEQTTKLTGNNSTGF